ncbi:hypothetical protein Q5P01_025985 [Channa striata]|uniref:Uncharacterized protein n=1 Tax=Channa striata TaxID=64152 RepID=A0AA88IFJ2_CHASR|nr:hypothetical protein Q5P01_025985 [Channa striata]
MGPGIKAIYDTVEFIQPVQPANPYFNFDDIKSQAVLDSSVQKYRIKLSKKRKQKVRKKCWTRSHGTLSDSSSPTSSQLLPASVFYTVPAAASGAEKEQQASTVKSGGHSPRIVTKIKAALKEKTTMKAAQPKEDRGK